MLQIPTCMASYECAHTKARQSDHGSGRSDSVQQQMGKATFNLMIKYTGSCYIPGELSRVAITWQGHAKNKFVDSWKAVSVVPSSSSRWLTKNAYLDIIDNASSQINISIGWCSPHYYSDVHTCLNQTLHGNWLRWGESLIWWSRSLDSLLCTCFEENY
jgi:hypothetical protein